MIRNAIKKPIFILILIVLLGFLLRVINLGNTPFGLNYKEATIGWRAQNIIEFGKDEYGRFIPIMFSDWQDINLPFPTYLATLFLWIDNTNIFFLRLPFALMGSSMILAGYLLALKFSKDKLIAILTGFVLAINPFGVFFSRFVSAEICAVACFLWGLYFILEKNLLKQSMGMLFLLFSLLSSKISLFFIPFFLIGFIFKFKEYKKPIFFTYFFIFIVFVLLFITPGGRQSVIDNDLSLFKEKSIIDGINSLRGASENYLVTIVNTLLFNKLFLVVKIIENYLSFFNPSFIFSSKGFNVYTLNQTVGLFLLVFLPLLLVGIKRIFEMINIRFLIAFWLLLAPIPGIFNIIAPSEKFLFALFPLSFLIAIGIASVGRIYKFVIAAVLLVNIIPFLFSFYSLINLPNDYWKPSSMEIVQKIDKSINDKVWITDKIDPNIGPLIGFKYDIPYTDSNLRNNPQNIYKGWVNDLKNINIGNFDKLKERYGDYKSVIVYEKKEEELFNCNKKTDVNIDKDKKYKLLERCNEK